MAASYLAKWTGEFDADHPQRLAKFPSLSFVLVTALGGFLALGVMSTSATLPNDAQDWLPMVGSFGATMVLVFAAPAGPFSQPRGVIGGQIVACIVGVGTRVWVSDPLGAQGPALGVPLSVTLTYLVMHATRTLNPPGGGTAAIAVIPSPAIKKLGWGLIVPVTLWSMVFVFVACAMINLLPTHRYPKYWFALEEDCRACRCARRGEEQEASKAETTKSEQIQQV